MMNNENLRQKVLFVFGTRPEAIKMAPLLRVLKGRGDRWEVRVCVTAQHREMLDQVLEFFDIEADYDLNLMRPNQTLHQITSDVILGLKPILEEFQPDYMFVHGDTSTTMSASLAAYYAQTAVCHIEAGLRTFNIYSPFPEEMNRRITGVISRYHFSPTETARENLLREGVDEGAVVVTGNTVIDALLWGAEINKNRPTNNLLNLQQELKGFEDYILVTAHRRENQTGGGLERICDAILDLVRNHNRQVVFPVHLSPTVQAVVREKLAGHENILLLDPQPYENFIWLMHKAKVILTDSGGIQEEAPSLGKPVLVMRDTTERPEAVTAGVAKLVSTDKELIVREVEKLYTDEGLYSQVSKIQNPYGDGKASERIVYFLESL